jgi:hypothetical protein
MKYLEAHFVCKTFELGIYACFVTKSILGVIEKCPPYEFTNPTSAMGRRHSAEQSHTLSLSRILAKMDGESKFGIQ